MNRNSIIGLTLIFVILMAMSLFVGKSNKKSAAAKSQYEQKLDSVQNAKDYIEATNIVVTEVSNDSLSPLFPAMSGIEETIILSNNLVEIGIDTKGAFPCFARLNNYNDQQNNKVILFDKEEISIDFRIDGKNRNLSTKELYFVPVSQSDNSVCLHLVTNGYGSMDITYSLNPDSYVLDMSLQTSGMEDFFSTDLSAMHINWIQNLRQQEKGFEFEQRFTALTYRRTDKKAAKILNVTKSTRSEIVEEPLDWVAFKNQFFSCIMIPVKNFEANSKLTASPYAKGKGYMKKMVAKTQVPFDPSGKEATQLQFYFGPNDYAILRATNGLIRSDHKARLNGVIDLGWPLVREFNRFLVIPLFNALSKSGLNMGLVILLLTIIVKVIVYPFTYKSYVSSAKMRALKPYIDEINKKYPKPEDAMTKQQEIMGIYSKYGVSPMGGCLPSLIQMPIWMAFFFFVPNAIELRQQSFLWATDLTGFDDIISWDNNIFLIGNHLSIFCVLFCLTNVINTWFTMKQQNATPGQEQTMNMMKWMMYIMPIVFFFTFNNYSSGLNYYYFVSALASIVIMIYLRRQTDEKAILAKLEANYEASRNDPNKRRQNNSMMARLEAMQKEQERLLKQQQQKHNNK